MKKEDVIDSNNEWHMLSFSVLGSEHNAIMWSSTMALFAISVF